MEASLQYVKPAVLYLRRSSDKQEQSIPDQRAFLERFAAQNGYSIVAEYCDDAISGSSAQARPDFLRMIQDAQQSGCMFKRIVVYDTSRFSRGDNIETSHYLYLLRERGVEVISATESFGDSDAEDILRPVAQWKANQYIKNLSRDTIRGQLSRVDGGWWPGGTPPFGFDLQYFDKAGKPAMKIRRQTTGEKLVFEPHRKQPRLVPRGEAIVTMESYRSRLVLSSTDRVQLVTRIFQIADVEGRGYRAIAAKFNEERILSPRDGNWSKNSRACWSASTIRAILMNRAYTGDTVWNQASQGRVNSIKNRQPQRRVRPRNSRVPRPKTKNDQSDWIVVPNTHPAIIDREQFERVQAQIRERGRTKTGESFRSGRSKDAPYLLTGLARCAKCGHPYYGRRVAKGKRRKDGTRVDTYFYVCSARLSKGKSVCDADSVPKDALESGVIDLMGQKVRAFLAEGGDKLLEDLVARELDVSTTDPKAAIKSVEGQIAGVDRKIDTLTEDVLNEVAQENREFFYPKLDQLREERDRLEMRANELRRVSQSKFDVRKLARTMVDSVRRFPEVFKEGTTEERREFVQLLIERVVLNAGEKKALVHIRRFPAAAALPGMLLLVLVAGVGFEPTTFGL